METKDVVLLNRRGKRIPTTFRITENAKGTFILLHGVGGWKEQRVMRAIIDPVVESGYSVVTFDASDGANAPDADSLSSTPTGYIEDLEDVIAHVQKESWYTAPLSLGGHSLGALAAVEYTKEHPEVEQLILVAPAISWKTYQYLVPVGLWWSVRGKVRMPGPELKDYWLGKAWVRDFTRFDGYHSAASISARTLVVIAGSDGLVGTKETHLRYAKAFKNGTSKVIDRASHTFYKYEQALTDTIKQWLIPS